MAIPIPPENTNIDDWLQTSARQLDLVLSEHNELADEFDVSPSEWAIVSTRAFLEFVYTHAEGISTPAFWLGPNGTIGLTWFIKDSRLDVQISEFKTQAHFSTGNKTESILPSKVSSVLMQIAA